MQLLIEKSYSDMSRKAAEIVAAEIKKKKRKTFKLGMATGSTPKKLYEILSRMNREKIIDFSDVITFNLDEYIGLSPSHPQSYHRYMQDNLFNHINIKPENIHIPVNSKENTRDVCREYEKKIRKAGGIDLQILGIGRNGHIGFNEPGTGIDSRTSEVILSSETISDNSRFFNSAQEVPRRAITMGIATIMDAKKILLIASGDRKAEALYRTISNPVSEDVPASLLRKHPGLTILCDSKAARLL